MADHSQQTEKPTKRRLEKARQEGQFAVSREFAASLQFFAFVCLLVAESGDLLDKVRQLTRAVFLEAFRQNLDAALTMRVYGQALTFILVPILVVGAPLSFMTLSAQLAATGLGFSLKKLAPDFQKLNPFEKLKNWPRNGIQALTQALLLLPIFGYAAYQIAAGNLTDFLRLPALGLEPALLVVMAVYRSLLWKACGVLFLLGCFDLWRQRQRYAKTLRMSKQEVKEEHKETEGNPQIKMRIRRIQRELARRTMMKEVPRATAVVVNPTHYSVAIRYEMESMAAPLVVAKGKNYLALRIRQIANEHQVPIIENQPLAQALYKSADVGQEIPPHLYRAVAEILAYLFKVMQRRTV